MNPIGVANSNAGTDHSADLRSLVAGGDVEMGEGSASWMNIFDEAGQAGGFLDGLAMVAGLDEVRRCALPFFFFLITYLTCFLP